jgi:HK97 family phage major capsid protein
MSYDTIASQVNAMGSAWEQFKQVNDARLDEIERKGSADALYNEHLTKISEALDNHKSRMDALEVANARPSFGGVEAKSYAPDSYSKAFCEYVRKGQETALDMQTKALSVGVDADGGYLVTPKISENIVRIVRESSPMRQLASVEVISTEGLDLIDDVDAAQAGWTTETGSVVDTDTPQFGKRNIPVFEMYAQPKATQKLVDDAAIDIEAWLAEKVAEVFSRLENTAFISGNGTAAPKGILSYAAGTAWGQIEQVNSGASAEVTADGLVRLYYSLKESYAANATFLMRRNVLQSVRLLKEATTNQYLWQPGLAAGAPDTLLGVPVMTAADMPAAAANSLSVAVGDFRAGYQIVDRTGIRILRDPFTDKPFVKFYTTKRVGGDVRQFDAIKLLKLAA